MFSPDFTGADRPVAPPRRKAMKKSPPSESQSRQQQNTSAIPGAGEPKKPLSPQPPANKPKPSRPEPPKFKPSTPTTGNQRQHQPLAGTKSSSPSSTSSHHTLLSKYYGQGNQYATAPSKSRRKRLKEEEEVNTKSTTIIYSREGAIYLNVAPKPEVNGRSSLGRSHSSENSTKAITSLQPPPPPSKQRRNKKASVPTSNDSKGLPVGSVLPKSHPRQTVSSSRSMPAVGHSSPGLPAKRVDFTKQPLPKTSSAGLGPLRPAPPLPYMYSKRSNASTSESAESYAYVDPTKFRYPPVQNRLAGLSRDLDGLDLNNNSAMVYATIPDEGVYTALVNTTADTGNDVYAVPNQQLVMKTTPSSQEVSDLSFTSSGSSKTDSHTQFGNDNDKTTDKAVYANVAPKLPQHLLRRAKSFTLNTTHSVQEAWPPESPSPTSAQPPSNRRVELHTCGGGGGGSESPQDEKETGPYTPICYDTLDKASIYQSVQSEMDSI